jgi:hypothetical protein
LKTIKFHPKDLVRAGHGNGAPMLPIVLVSDVAMTAA